MEKKVSFSEHDVYEKNCHNVQEYVQVESTVNSEESGHALLYIQDPSMEESHGEQHYVTIVQDGQTYAIPAADYEAMTARQAMHGDQEHDVVEEEKQHTEGEMGEVMQQAIHPVEHIQEAIKHNKYEEAVTNLNEQMEVSTTLSEHSVSATNLNDGIEVATNPITHMQVAINTTDHLQVETNTIEHMDVVTNTTEHMQVVAKNTEHMHMAANTTEHMEVVTNTTNDTQVAINPREHMQVLTNSSEHMRIVANTSEHMQVVTNPTEHMQIATNLTEHMRVVTNATENMQVATNPIEHRDIVPNTTKHTQTVTNPTEHMQVVTNNTEQMQIMANPTEHMQVMASPINHVHVVANPSEHIQASTNPPENIKMVAKPTDHMQIVTNSNQHMLVRTTYSGNMPPKLETNVTVPTVLSDLGKKAAIELQKQNLSALRKLNFINESKIQQRPTQSNQAELMFPNNYKKMIDRNPQSQNVHKSQNIHKNNSQPVILESENQMPISYKMKMTEKPEYGMPSVQNNGGKTLNMKTSENISNPSEKISSVSMKWMTGGTSKVTEKPILPKIQQKAKPDIVEAEEIKKTFKPIRVDNWGIFLLSRLQAYFHKKEFCDLTLRFPSKNAQIKVHKLVINACTDFFIAAEKEGKVSDGCIDMPSTFTPETVAPIIRFMYTGKLEIKDGIFSKLHDAASSLQMSVLTKLMDAQLMAPTQIEDSNRRRKRKRFDDPVQQIRKIKRIERRVMNDELKAKRLAKLEHLAKIKSEEDIMERTKLPGKKLPIWKKRSSTTEPEVKHPIAVNSFSPLNAPAYAPLNAPSYPYKIPKIQQLAPEVPNKIPEKTNTPVSANTVPIIQKKTVVLQSEPVGDLKVKQETSFRKGAVSTTYGKSRPTNGPKFPRKLQEIQQHLMFEKIMRTGTKNNIVVKNMEEPEDKQLSVEEIKELMIEQKQRTALGEDLNDYEDDYDNYELDDDYIDNEDMDEYQGSNGKESVITQINEIKHVDNSRLIQETHPITVAEKPINLESQAQNEKQLSRPILKHTNLMETPQPEAPRKSVRFSLRACPENVKTVTPDPRRENIELMKARIENEATNATKTNEVTNVSKVIRKSLATQDKEQKQFELDAALEEFTRVAEQEEKELSQEFQNLAQDDNTKNVGSNLVLKKRGRPPKPKAAETKDPREETAVNVHEQVENGSKNVNSINDQANVISEVLKKYPSLFKDNKHVKIKVLTKDPMTGKESMQYITLKTQPGQQKESTESSFLQSLKNVPKVMYTGKRGRPKKIKPGMYDPHAAERKKIEDRITSNYPQILPGPGAQLEEGVDPQEYGTLANFSQVDPGVQASGTTPQLDPSSEAEAFSNVASGIAASLGLVEQQQQMHHHIGAANHQQGDTAVIVPQPGLAMYHGGPQEDLVDQGQIQIVTTSASADQLQIVSSMGQRVHYVTNPQHLQFINTGRPGAVLMGEQASWVPVIDTQAEASEEKPEEKRKVMVQIADDWDTEEDE